MYSDLLIPGHYEPECFFGDVWSERREKPVHRFVEATRRRGFCGGNQGRRSARCFRFPKPRKSPKLLRMSCDCLLTRPTDGSVFQGARFFQVEGNGALPSAHFSVFKTTSEVAAVLAKRAEIIQRDHVGPSGALVGDPVSGTTNPHPGGMGTGWTPTTPNCRM